MRSVTYADDGASSAERGSMKYTYTIWRISGDGTRTVVTTRNTKSQAEYVAQFCRNFHQNFWFEVTRA